MKNTAGFPQWSGDEIQALFEEWLILEGNDKLAEDAGQAFSVVINGSSIYPPFSMLLAYEAGMLEAERQVHNLLPIADFSAMLDKFERLVLLQQAERNAAYTNMMAGL